MLSVSRRCSFLHVRLGFGVFFGEYPGYDLHLIDISLGPINSACPEIACIH